MYLLLELNCALGSWNRSEGSFLSGSLFNMRCTDGNVEEVISLGFGEEACYFNSIGLQIKH